MNTTEEGDEPLGENPEIGIRAPKYSPLREVTMYQARCTNCGLIVDDYGDFSCMDDDSVINEVRGRGWFERTREEPSPTLNNPDRIIVHTVELLCPDCQACDVCGATDKVHVSDDDEHMVCGDHEDHEFEATV